MYTFFLSFLSIQPSRLYSDGTTTPLFSFLFCIFTRATNSVYNGSRGGLVDAWIIMTMNFTRYHSTEFFLSSSSAPPVGYQVYFRHNPYCRFL